MVDTLAITASSCNPVFTEIGCVHKTQKEKDAMRRKKLQKIGRCFWNLNILLSEIKVQWKGCKI